MNTKLHAVADADGRPIRFLMTSGQVSGYTGAAALLGSLPKADSDTGRLPLTRFGGSGWEPERNRHCSSPSC